MKTCRICGFHNPDNNERCTNCQSLLQTPKRLLRPAPWRELKSWLPTLTFGLLEKLWRWCPLRRCWELPPTTSLPYRYPWLAAFLALLPPFGQLYNRQFGKAVVLAGAFWCTGAVAILTLRHPWSNALLLVLFLFWVFICTDAFVTAIRINGEDWSFRNSIATWCAMLFYAGVAVTAVQFLLPMLFLFGVGTTVTVLTSLGRLRHTEHSWKSWTLVLAAALLILVGVASMNNSGRIFAFVRLSDDIGSGKELRRGDLLLVSYSAYWFRPPQLGEIVHYDPPAFRAEQPNSATMIAINAKDYFQRIAGQGGDIIETSPPRLLRNGTIVAKEHEPLGLEIIAVARQFHIPPKHYFLPMTNIPRESLNVPPPPLFHPGWVFPKWEEACIVPAHSIMGKVLAIVDPPQRRRWF